MPAAKSSTTEVKVYSGVPSARISTGSEMVGSRTCLSPSTRSCQATAPSDRRKRQYGVLPPASAVARCSGVSLSMARS